MLTCDQMKYTPTSRRTFIKYAGLAVVASSLKGQSIIGANERVRIALIGCGRQGSDLSRYFTQVPGVELVAICDPDTAQMDALAHKLANPKAYKGQPARQEVVVETIQDYRKVYERSDIDAVIIASPTYWHTLQAIQAMEAGKHVYVEKPVCFTPWEALQLEAAERKYGKIIAAGYQNRSDPGPQVGIRYVQDGKLGKIKKIRSLCFRNRASIGRRESPLKPPATVDYDLWLGPMQDKPIMRPEFHYDWHWDFNTGQGDIGNQGVHEIDMVCWLLGEPALPNQIQSFGNRFAWNDGGNTPNLQSSWYQVDGVDVIIEANDLTLAPNRNVAKNRFGTRTGLIVECENGILKGGRYGMMATELDGKTIIERFKGNGGKGHQQNFIDAIRANDAGILKARIGTSTNSAILASASNISYRSGELASNQELLKLVGGRQELTEVLTDGQAQLAAWGIKDPSYYWGEVIDINPASRMITNPSIRSELKGPHYRKGYELTALV